MTERLEPEDEAFGEAFGVAALVVVAAELVEHALGVDGVPGDDRVDDDRVAERLLALRLGHALPDMTFVGVEDRAPQRVQLLALVQLPADARTGTKEKTTSTSDARILADFTDPRTAEGPRN